MNTFAYDDVAVKAVGRADFSNALQPKMWAAGAHFNFGFEGDSCEIDINDEQLYGTNYNYLEIIVDSMEPRRIRTQGVANRIILGRAAQSAATDTNVNVVELELPLSNGHHEVTVVKDTETGMGYIQLCAIRAQKIVPMAQRNDVIEFIGNSITCGAEAYLDEVKCGEGTWFDRHQAYMAYGPRTARALGYEWMLTSVSGIGLIHSCCDMTVTMPQVFDKVELYANRVDWDFSRCTPKIVCVCLGQNDGQQDSTQFCTAYVDFIKNIRGHYPNARIVCLSSPMADEELTIYLKKMVTSVVDHMNVEGDNGVEKFFFSRSYNSGCGGHPDIVEHELIADELIQYLRN